jgi:hypothetical protein
MCCFEEGWWEVHAAGTDAARCLMCEWQQRALPSSAAASLPGRDVTPPSPLASATHALAGGASVSHSAMLPPLSPWPATTTCGPHTHDHAAYERALRV